MRFPYFSTVAALSAMLAAPAFALQLTAADVSNQIVSCDSPLLHDKPAGSCLANPADTLVVTAKLDAGDDPSMLNLVYVLLRKGGQTYLYNGDPTAPAAMGQAGIGRWKRTSMAFDTTLVAADASTFVRAPFETDTVSRQVSIADIKSLKGAEVWVGVRKADGTVFPAGASKKVFTLK